MPAKFVKSYRYVAPDGEEFETLQACQKHEIETLVPEGTPPPATDAELALFMVNNADRIMEILKQKERKRTSPGAAKTRKPRTPKPPATPAA